MADNSIHPIVANGIALVISAVIMDNFTSNQQDFLAAFFSVLGDMIALNSLYTANIEESIENFQEQQKDGYEKQKEFYEKDKEEKEKQLEDKKKEEGLEVLKKSIDKIKEELEKLK